MKKIILSLFTTVSLLSFSQQMSDTFLNLEYNVSVSSESHTDSIFIDSDENVDIIITSWFVYEPGFENLGIEMIVKDYDNDFSNNFVYVKDEFNNILIQDCHLSGDPSLTAYIYTNNLGYVNYTSGYKKIPFQFESSDGNHCGFLFVKYNNNLITVTGYSWNLIPKGTSGGNCVCNNDYLSINELSEINSQDNISKYFNTLGQEVKEPHGVTIVLYESGLTKKVYFE